MHDRRWVLPGIVVFLALFSFPFWANSGRHGPPPVVEIAEKARAEGQCVLPVASMRTDHMRILDQWRQTVVREGGSRTYVAPGGREYQMSISSTCLDCHSNKKQFCDRCHEYAAVSPYCWKCHIDPAQGLEEVR